MKVILNTDVPNLGEDGDVVEVAAGYARNYLLPRKFAALHNAQSLAALESRKAHIQRQKEEKRKEAMGSKEKILSMLLTITMPSGETGKLFGSVSSANIAEELGKAGIAVERKKIEVPGNVIKHTGDYKVSIKLYGNESAELKVKILGTSEKNASVSADLAAAEATEPAQSEEAASNEE